MAKDKIYMGFLEILEREMRGVECREFGMKEGCKRTCPVFEAEQCPNQYSNEVFFNWMETKQLENGLDKDK